MSEYGMKIKSVRAKHGLHVDGLLLFYKLK